jgi:hypothetical protein
MGSLYLDRLARTVPPRDTGPMGTANGAPTAPGCRVIAANNATTSVELDNDLFQFTPPPNTPAVPGSYGRALLRVHAEGNDLYVLFGAASTVAANSAATSGNTQSDHIPAGQERDFEVDPTIDKWMSARTQNGSTNTATCRYRIVSLPTNTSPGSG